MFAGLVAVNVLQENTGRVGVTHVPGVIIVGQVRIRTRGNKKLAKSVLMERLMERRSLHQIQHALRVTQEKWLHI